jgi:hypothetical protein
MTTTTVHPLTQTPRDGIHRVLAVTRLHLTNTVPLLALPWMILGFIFLVNLAIWWIIVRATDGEAQSGMSEGTQFSGATMFIFIYMMVVAVQAVNVSFQFALGYSVTRRDYYLGTSVVFVLLSAYYAVGMAILAEIERASNGWGVGGGMFDVVYFGADNLVQRFALFFLVFLFFFFIGAASSAVYVRWRSNGMIVFFAALTLVIVGLVALATLTDSWPAVGEWFVSNGALGVAAWSLLPTAVAAVTGFLLLRRATAKN